MLSLPRIYGEVWSEISAIGDKFKDQAKLVPMVQVGKPGQIGVAQFVDITFTVADILPGRMDLLYAPVCVDCG